MDTTVLTRLADLLATRNQISKQIAAVIGRPDEKGHLSEFIASQVFDIALEPSAVNKGFDGRFSSGSLAGMTVDVKYSAKRDGLINLRRDALPDYYLVLTGPAGAATTSRGKDRPWLIEAVYLFEARVLIDALKHRGVKIGDATSVAQEYWRRAELYPSPSGGPLTLTPDQCEALALFGERRQVV